MPEFKLHAQTKVVHENADAERWIVEVNFETADNAAETYLVYVDPDRIEVTGHIIEGKRNAFGWDDWLLDNVEGNIEGAALICGLAVYLGPNYNNV